MPESKIFTGDMAEEAERTIKFLEETITFQRKEIERLVAMVNKRNARLSDIECMGGVLSLVQERVSSATSGMKPEWM